ncbi:MAG: hypothetical protein ABIA93_00525 [Candidatus Woesearchaeota archaeon]
MDLILLSFEAMVLYKRKLLLKVSFHGRPLDILARKDTPYIERTGPKNVEECGIEKEEKEFRVA